MSQTTLEISGMTCGHCAQHVTDELSALAGVSNINVDLHAGQTSIVTFDSNSPLSDEDIREAVSEAGDYTVESINVK
ncbi:heavy-metal-associated domain-containing protein [Arcanobacterium pinnipediorum]|uniref:Heavy-metal-associated domain-containing protein n=1 Tax=Arcanobacterium pinnipediorum TaxID=1503041 RepID=A0ABY5AHF7_9ACTO|nr:heavy-metal-associated domain-containing protein [Arcanobacterium pinnipediorum]USR79522.1 heavy-metal-associated domain-containing protein [Arcanobacterium pinnipediorum]